MVCMRSDCWAMGCQVIAWFENGDIRPKANAKLRLSVQLGEVGKGDRVAMPILQLCSVHFHRIEVAMLLVLARLHHGKGRVGQE